MRKAVRLDEIGKPLERPEVPAPKVEPNDILVPGMGVGSCHSDTHYRAGLSPTADISIILEPEVVGTVDNEGVAWWT